MPSIPNLMEELRKQLRKGSIQKAYQALLAYMSTLRTHFTTRYGDRAVSGLYQGYLDMTYFAVFPPSLKHLDLKVAIVFNYEAFEFEAWLAARNRKLQRQYWELFKDRNWATCRIVAPAAGIDAILQCDLTHGFDLRNPHALTSGIETATDAFIHEIERCLSAQEPDEEATPRAKAG